MKKSINKILSVFLVLVIVFAMVPNITIAAVSDKVTVRIEGTGSTVLLEPTEVSVSNGATAEDALKAALIKAGQDPSSSSVLSAPGGYINTLLGTSADSVHYTTYWMYTLNNEIASYGIGDQKVYNGDELVFYFVESYQSVYAYFDKPALNVKTCASFSLKLKTYGYDSSWNPVIANCPGATLVVDGTDSAYTTDSDGNVSLSFTSAGTYIISAKKLSGSTNILDAAYCKVVVTDTEPAATSRLEGLAASGSGSSLILSPEFIPCTLNYRVSVPYGTSTVTVTPTATSGSIKINSDSVTLGAGKDVNLSVGINVVSVTIDSTEYKLIVTRAPKTIQQSRQTQLDNIISACKGLYVNSQDYWESLGMAKAKKGAAVDTAYVVSAAITEANKAQPSAATLGMWICTLTALGYDCASLPNPSGGNINLIEKLCAISDAALGAYAGNYIGWLWGVNSGGYAVPSGAALSQDDVITKLIATQNSDGGWYYSYGGTQYTDVDTAAMALSALAPYYNTKPAVKTAADKAVLWMQGQLLSSGGYGNANTDAIAITGLLSLGIDPDGDSRFIKNGKSIVDDMMSYKTSGNLFGYMDTTFNGFATKQAFCAAMAYNEYLKNTNSAYNIYISGMPSGAVAVSSIAVSANPLKTIYELNQSFDCSGLTILVSYSNSASETISATSYMISGFDSTTAGAKTVTVTYGGKQATLGGISVVSSTDNTQQKTTKTALISVIGDSGSFLSQTSITAEKDASVFTILKKALSNAGIEIKYTGSGSSVYVTSIGGLSEFDKGSNSGWKYYVNGIAPSVGCGSYIPSDGDMIEFKYTTDYTKDSNFSDIDTQIKTEQQQEKQKQDETLKPFNDQKDISSWSRKYMADAVTLGIIKGDTNGKLNPGANITRGEFCAMLIRAMKLDTGDAAAGIYSDVQSDSWYFGFINKAAALGIVKGKGDGTFSPDTPVTRQDMAVMVSNAFGLQFKNNTANFGDTNKIASYAYDAVLKVFSNSIMSGDGSNFNPLDNSTREMAVTVLLRYLENNKN